MMNLVSYSQYNEDLELLKYYNHKSRGFYVEVGAFDGINLSNTYLFEQIGWTGILIEAIPDLAKLASQNRKRSIVENCVCVGKSEVGYSDFEILKGAENMSSREIVNKNILKATGGVIEKIRVPAKTLDRVLEENNVKEIDFITIDVEGFEMQVLDGFSMNKWKPKIVIIEGNGLIPNKNILKYMTFNKFRFCKRTGINDWYIYDQEGKGSVILKTYFSIYLQYFKALFRKIYNRIFR